MSFEKAVEFTLSFEGGLVDDPNDIGGVTNFGISQRSFPDLNIRTLTREQATEIYKTKYWNAIRGDELHPAVAFTLFDFAVNSGVQRAIQTMQQVVGTKADGDFGPKTLAAIQSKTPRQVVEGIVQLRGIFLLRLVAIRRDQLRFIEGWARRVISCGITAGELL